MNESIIPERHVDKQAILKAAREDPGVFLSYVFGFPMAPMHKDWLRTVSTHERTLLVGPRGHGKSSVMSLAFPCWYIGNHPNARIKIVSCSDQRAYGIIYAIFRCLKDNDKYHEVFPDVHLETKRPSRNLFIRRDKAHQSLKDATLECFGVQASAEGARADLIILDDVVSRKNSQTPGLRNMVREQFYNVHINLLEPDVSKMIYIGSIWNEDDLTVHLMQKGERWKKCVFAIDENFTPLWPQKWSKEKLIERCNEIGISRFNLGFRNFPFSSKSYLVPEGLYNQCIDTTLPIGNLETVALENIQDGRWRVVIGVDLTAVSPKTNASKWAQKNRRGYNVIYVLAYDVKTGIRIPIDIVRDQTISAPNFVRLLASKATHYKAEIIMVESNAYQHTLTDWLKELYQPLIPLIHPIYTTGEIHDVETGLSSFRTEFETRQWRIPSSGHPISCPCGWCSFKTEITSYPFLKQRDTLLAAYQAKEGLRRFFTATKVGGFTLWQT